MDLCGGRLSDHRFMSILFYLYLYLYTVALTLLVRLRSELPDPPDPARRTGRSAPLPDAACSSVSVPPGPACPPGVSSCKRPNAADHHLLSPPRTGPPITSNWEGSRSAPTAPHSPKPNSHFTQ